MELDAAAALFKYAFFASLFAKSKKSHHKFSTCAAVVAFNISFVKLDRNTQAKNIKLASPNEVLLRNLTT